MRGPPAILSGLASFTERQAYREPNSLGRFLSLMDDVSIRCFLLHNIFTAKCSRFVAAITSLWGFYSSSMRPSSYNIYIRPLMREKTIPVNMPDPIQKCFGYSQDRAGSYKICWIGLPASDWVPPFQRSSGSYCAKPTRIRSGWPGQGLAKRI